MTEAELWQMMLLASENTFSGLAGVSTVFFAYLAAAYFVGAKLSRSQAALATVFFMAGAGCWSFFTFVFYRRAIYFMDELSKNYGIESFAPNDTMLPVFPTILTLLILACVYFMYQVRKSPRSGSAPD
jgi:hypothetical protein